MHFRGVLHAFYHLSGLKMAMFAQVCYKPCFARALQWASNAAEALAYLHGRDCPIIHRDLKPMNLFLTRDLQASRLLITT